MTSFALKGKNTDKKSKRKQVKLKYAAEAKFIANPDEKDIST